MLEGVRFRVMASSDFILLVSCVFFNSFVFVVLSVEVFFSMLGMGFFTVYLTVMDCILTLLLQSPKYID